MSNLESLRRLSDEHYRTMLHHFDEPKNRGINCQICDSLETFSALVIGEGERLAVDAVRAASDNITMEYAASPWTAALTHPVPKGRIEALETAVDGLIDAVGSRR